MSRLFDLGPLRLDAEAKLLSRAGVPVTLGSRAIAVLDALVECAPRMVSKADLLDRAWHGVVVEESNLAVQISAIRKALKDVPGAADWIETVPWRGYRFAGPVTRVAAAHAAPARIAAVRTNIAARTTSFIGREREQDEIAQHLRTARAVTIVGAGGSGKTRLALEVATRQADAYPDGVWLVALASVAEPHLVADTVAQVLGIRQQGPRALAETLVERLQSRRALLVFDNCEHLRAACAELVATLVERAPRLTILATSREPLDVAGEVTYRLDPLTLPAPGASLEAIAGTDAVRLFVARATQQQPDFTLDAASAPTVAQVCADLDGMPLALELAAARLHSLPIAEIAERLADRFRLLTTTAPTDVRHHQTLRTVLDWSYDLLAQDERIVLRRMAVFVDGGTIDGIVSVVADPALDAHAAVDVLARLVRRSLVIGAPSPEDPRYRMLVTTRAYALEKLAEAGEDAAVRNRHAAYCRRVFGDTYERWFTMSDDQWRAACAPELADVRAALAWAFGPGAAAVGVALAGSAVQLFVGNLAQRNEGRRWLAQAAAHVNDGTPNLDRARLALGVALLAEITSLAKVSEAFARAIELYRLTTDEAGLGYALACSAYALAYANRLDEAEAALAEARSLLAGTAHVRGLVHCGGALASIRYARGDVAGALAAADEAIGLCRSVGAQRSEMALLVHKCEIAWFADDLDSARASAHAAVALARLPGTGDSGALCRYLLTLVGVQVASGEYAAARQTAHEVEPLCRDSDLAPLLLDHLALRAGAMGRLADAARIAGHSDAARAASDLPRQSTEARARERLDALLAASLAPDEVARHHADGAAMPGERIVALALAD